MPKLHFYYGAMNAGKSALLIQTAHNYIEKKFKIQIFSTTGSVVSSRTGLTMPATHLARGERIQLEDDVTCVLIDEAQFLTAYQIYELVQIANHIPVVAFGLRTNYLGSPFEGSAYLMALAHELHEIKSLCSCGKKATMNIRLDENGQRVTRKNKLVDLHSNYESMCSQCFFRDASQIAT